MDASGVLEGAAEVVGKDRLGAGEEGGVEGGAQFHKFGAAEFNEAVAFPAFGEVVEGVVEEGVGFFLGRVFLGVDGGFEDEPALTHGECAFVFGGVAELGGELGPVDFGLRVCGELGCVGVLPDRAFLSPERGVGGFEVETVEVFDELGDGCFNAAGLLSVGRLFEGLPEFGEFLVEFSTTMDEGIADRAAEAGFAAGIEELEVAGEAELKGEGADDAEEETVEGLEVEAMHGAHHESQEGVVAGGVGLDAEFAGELRGGIGGSGGVAEFPDDAVEEFPGGVAGKGERDDAFRLLREVQEGDETVRELVGFTGARGGRDRYVLKG